MVELSFIRDLVTVIGVLIALAYYIVNIRHQRETRQAQLFMTIYQNYYDKEWLRDQQKINFFYDDYSNFDEFMEKYGPYNNMEGYLTYQSRVNFYEGLGVLVKRNLIDVSMVDDLLSGPIVLFWEKKAHPLVNETRRRFNNPAAYEWVEYLYEKVKAVRDREHPDKAGTTPMDGYKNP
jgi:hypothetical protein